jgi:hypothetical protein
MFYTLYQIQKIYEFQQQELRARANEAWKFEAIESKKTISKCQASGKASCIEQPVTSCCLA